MRKILITLAIVIALVVAIVCAWIFSGRQISLYLDRLGTIQIKAEQIKTIRYEGSGTGGILRVNDSVLTLNSPIPAGSPPSVGSTKDGQLALAAGGKVFAFGPLPKTNEEASEVMATVRPPGDEASINIRR